MAFAFHNSLYLFLKVVSPTPSIFPAFHFPPLPSICLPLSSSIQVIVLKNELIHHRMIYSPCKWWLTLVFYWFLFSLSQIYNWGLESLEVFCFSPLSSYQLLFLLQLLFSKLLQYISWICHSLHQKAHELLSVFPPPLWYTPSISHFLHVCHWYLPK